MKRAVSWILILTMIFASAFISGCDDEPSRKDKEEDGIAENNGLVENGGSASSENTKNKFENVGNDPNNLYNPFVNKIGNARTTLAFDNDYIYYSDFSLGYSNIFKIDFEGKNKTEVFSLAGDSDEFGEFCCLNVLDNYLYYGMDSSDQVRVYRMSLDTMESEVLARHNETSEYGSLAFVNLFVFKNCVLYSYYDGGSEKLCTYAYDTNTKTNNLISVRNSDGSIGVFFSTDNTNAYVFEESRDGYNVYKIDVDHIEQMLEPILKKVFMEYDSTKVLKPSGIAGAHWVRSYNRIDSENNEWKIDYDKDYSASNDGEKKLNTSYYRGVSIGDKVAYTVQTYKSSTLELEFYLCSDIGMNPQEVGKISFEDERFASFSRGVYNDSLYLVGDEDENSQRTKLIVMNIDGTVETKTIT